MIRARLLSASLLLLAACSSKSGSPDAAPGDGSPGTGGAGGSHTGGSGGGSAGTGGMNTGGMAPGSGGAGPTGGSGGVPSTGASVLERNKNPSRDGLFVDAKLTKVAAAKMAMDANFKPVFQGAVWASPLYLENGPGGKGLLFIETINNDVFAFDETTGATVWTKKVGPAPANNGSGCGNIAPFGIIATPIIDAQSRTIYISAPEGADTTMRQTVHALSVDDGGERAGWPVDVSGKGAFDPKVQNPRSALSLVAGILYVAYGGHRGDCGAYHGRVAAIDVKDPTKVGVWSTAGQAEGIWASGGMASDGNGVIAVTGNRMPPGNRGAHQDSEEVVRLTGMAQLDRASGVYYPTTWQDMDGGDADFGSVNPLVASLPGNNPPRVIVAIAKDAMMYLLNPSNLGGMGGHIAAFDLSTGNVLTTPTAFTNAKGLHVAITVNAMAACPAGGPGGNVVMTTLISPGSPPTNKVLWCAPTSGGGAPITSTTDGTAEPIVWYLAGGQLRGVDGETGQAIASPMDPCGNATQWSSPIVAKGRVIAAVSGRMCAWSPAP
jgi:hypothetical protein